MGSSTSKSIAADTAYTDSSWYTGSTKGTVKVRSCRVKSALGLGVHHCIVVECPSMDKWVVYGLTTVRIIMPALRLVDSSV